MQPHRTLILAHRDELLRQAQDKLLHSTGLLADIEKAHEKASLDAPVVVGSVQTLMREKRLQRWPRDHFKLVVCDEAHHVLADSYQNVLRHFDGHARVLGVTATPDRGDKRSLGEYFEDIAYEVGLHELIEDKFLSPIKVRTLPLRIDLNGVRTTAGDYNDADLGSTLEPYLGAIVKELVAAVGRRKTLVFLPLIRTSMEFVRLCREAGLSAEHVDGNSPDRKDILRRFACGEIQVLSNSMLLTEGFDEPSVECVVCLRPTKVRALYSQIIGRGTRICPGKEDLLVLDFLWMTEKHALVRPAHLVAPSEEIARQMTEISEDEAQWDMESDLLELATDAKETREQALAEALQANSKRQGRLIDPIQFALSLHEIDLADWEPTMRWHADAPSDKQLELLGRLGFNPDAILSKGYASALLDKIMARRDLRLATPKQVRWLERTGHPSPETATFEEASEWLSGCFGEGRAV
jgi:superfamily II DNA or RNA helicase